MPDLSKFKTAHQIARDLLAGPDLIVVIPTAVFDMPGAFRACPARVEVTNVDSVDVVIIAATDDSHAKQPAEAAPVEGKK